MKKLILLFFIFHFSLSFGQSWDWGKQGNCETIHDVGEGNSVAVDNSNNVYLVGYFVDTITFVHDTITNNLYPRNDAFLVKYDSIGNLLWVRTSSTGLNATCQAFPIATNISGDVYIAGRFKDTVFFYPDTIISSALSDDVFLTKYDKNGNVIWAKSSKGYNYAGSNSVSVDRKNNVYITGVFSDTVVFGATKLYSPMACFYIARYAPNGQVIWANQSSTNSNTTISIGNSLINDHNGNVYVAGAFHDSMKLGTQLLTSKATDAFIAKYDSNGNVIWAKDGFISNSHGFGNINSVCIDQFGNSYITGDFLDSISFGGRILYSSTLYDLFIVKYDPNGNVIWAKSASLNDSNGWTGYSIAIDSIGHLYLSCGALINSGHIYLFYGQDTLTLNNPEDPSLFWELDTAGHFMCGTILASGGDDQNGVACDSRGKYIYMGGDLVSGQSYIFGNDTLFGIGGEFPWISRWQPCTNISTEINQIYSMAENIALFPNPNKGQFTITFTHPELVSASQTNIEIYNVFGEQVLTEPLRSSQGDNTINLSNQPNGVYLYRVISESGLASGEMIGEGKLIIQK